MSHTAQALSHNDKIMLHTETIKAVDGKPLPLTIWQQEGSSRPKSIVQILHGMTEHSLRYGPTAERLAAQGHIVVSCDHRGHGNRCEDSNELGYLGGNKGWQLIQADTYSVNQYIRSQHHATPLFLLGHSMGSIVALDFIQHHRNLVDGVILSGSFFQAPLISRATNLIARLERIRQGGQGRSTIIKLLTFDAFNRTFRREGGQTGYEWLTRDPAIAQAYAKDERCGFTATNEFWDEFTAACSKIFTYKSFKRLPKDIPYYLLSGTKDPVGGRKGERVRTLANKIKQAGVSQIETHLYPEGRHEMFNEVNRDEVVDNLLEWLEKMAQHRHSRRSISN